MNLNKVLLIGRLTADPQLRATKTGQNVAVFSVATNRVWNDKNNQKQEQVEFHNIVVWGKQAEVASKFLVKGQVAMIEGRIQSRDYEDKAGVKRRVTEIVADRIQFGQKPGSAGSTGGGARSSAPTGTDSSAPSAPEEIPTINIDEEIKAEDLPF